MNPAGLDFISVTYDEGGQTKRLLFSPGKSFFGLPSHFNQFVAEWFNAIRDAITAATGQVPGNTPPGQLGVPPSSKAILALYLMPVLIGIGFLALLVAHPSAGLGSLFATSLEAGLILLVLFAGAGVALAGTRRYGARAWLLAGLVAALLC